MLLCGFRSSADDLDGSRPGRRACHRGDGARRLLRFVLERTAHSRSVRQAFVAEVASGEPYGDWHLASDASRQAVQAWAARTSLGDLGRRLRSARPLVSPSDQEFTWTCVMAHELVGLGTVGGVTSFDEDDAKIVTKQALQSGVAQSQITAMVHDAETVPFRDLAFATSLVCGPPL